MPRSNRFRKLPELDVLLSDGSTRALASFYAQKPLALIFLRHLNCLFCHQQVEQLRNHPDWNVAFVGMAPPLEAQQFIAEYLPNHPVLCDPDRRLYRMFDLQEGRVGQLVGPKVLARAVSAMRQGHHNLRPVRHSRQLAGVFVIAPSGEVRWEYRSRNAADNPTPDDVRRHLLQAES